MAPRPYLDQFDAQSLRACDMTFSVCGCNGLRADMIPSTSLAQLLGETLSKPVKHPKRRGWIWLVVIGLVTSIIGIIVGSMKAGGMCGSVFSPKSQVAELYDTLQGSFGGAAADCKESIAAAAVPTWILIVLGVILVLAGVIIRSIGNNRTTVITAAAAPSVASQIEDLSRLKEQGLVSDEEFEAKRTELLSRL
jgi:hypothetical protein